MSKSKDGVRHVKDNIYEINYYPHSKPINGKRKRVYQHIRANSSKEARLERLRRMTEGEPKPNQARTSFGALKDRLELKLRGDSLTEGTITNYLPKFKSFFEEFLPKKHPNIQNIHQITSPIIESYRQYITLELKRPDGWRDEITKLRTLFRKLIAIGECSEETYTELKKVEKGRKNKKQYKEVSKKELTKLLAYIKEERHDYYGITYMIMRLGWRRTQVISIKKDNILWDKYTPIAIKIDPQDTKTKEPVILKNLDRELTDVIKEYALDRKNKSPYLFPNRNGGMQHANHYTIWIGKASEKILGKHLTPHDFRHSFVTTRLHEGSTREDIMAITGHKDQRSFDIYAHPISIGTKKVLKDSRLFE